MMQDLAYGDRILARLTLKGNFIRAAGDPSLYMGGEAFGVRSGDIRTGLHESFYYFPEMSDCLTQP